MQSLFTKPLDRWAMRLGAPTVCITGKSPNPHLESIAVDWASNKCEIGAPKDLVLQSTGQFRFSSIRPGPWAENNVVHGKLIRGGRDWTARPTAILVHGWNGEYSYDYLFPYLGWRLRRAGLNAAMIELPYHRQRKPRHPAAIRNFLSDDLDAMVEAVRQAVADLRCVLAWLKEAGSPALGLWGISLGAWLSGLVASLDQRAACLVLLTPVPDMARAIRELPFCASIRHCLPSPGRGLDALGLPHHKPLTPQVLIIESKHDLFAPVETVEHLWTAWGSPEIWRVPHGHISVLFSLPILERIVYWLARRLGPLPFS